MFHELPNVESAAAESLHTHLEVWSTGDTIIPWSLQLELLRDHVRLANEAGFTKCPGPVHIASSPSLIFNAPSVQKR